jgi:hypothetical protein
MIEKIFKKAMGFLKQPEKAFDREKGTDVMEAFKYLALLFLVVSVLSAVISLNPASFVAIYVMGIIFSVIAGLWLHLWAYVFGAKKGLHQTLKAFFYGGTPSYLLGWIPFIGLLFWVWALYLQWIGLQRLQDMKGNRAAFSILVAFIIPIMAVAVLTIMAYTLILPFLSTHSGYPEFQLPY